MVMRVLTGRWVAGGAAVGSVALMAGALVLAYVDRHRVPAGLTGWDFSDVFGGVANLAVLAFVFLLFPTGQVRSRRWRPVAWFVGAAFTLIAVDWLVNATRFWSDPFGSASQTGNPLVLAPLLILMPAALMASVAAVVVRFARSAGEERLQLEWFAAAALLVVATFIASIFVNSVAVDVVQNVAFLCLWAAIGIAVLKYRLYEIDVVISKAVLYGSLAVFITAVYAGLVVGVGTLAGGL